MTTVRRFAAIALLCGIGHVPVAADADEVGEIRDLVRAGKHEAALARLDAYLADAPGDTQARFLKGVVLAETNETEAALEVFGALAEENPELPEPHNNLAVLHAAQGDYDKAREALLVAINTHPAYATAHENLGDIYAKMAMIAYDKALQLDDANRAAEQKLALVRELFSAGRASAVEMPSARQTVVAAAPAPEAPAVRPRPAGDAQTEILATVRGWADAWSRQDVDAYLAYYSAAFEPEEGGSRDAWAQGRRVRLTKPGFIDVDVADPEVEMRGVDRARVTFRQGYRSDTYRDRVVKRLRLARLGEDWKILEERVIEVIE